MTQEGWKPPPKKKQQTKHQEAEANEAAKRRQARRIAEREAEQFDAVRIMSWVCSPPDGIYSKGGDEQVGLVKLRALVGPQRDDPKSTDATLLGFLRATGCVRVIRR